MAVRRSQAVPALRLNGITILCGFLRWGSMCALFCAKKLLPIRQKISHEIFGEKRNPPHPCQFYTAFKTKKRRKAAENRPSSPQMAPPRLNCPPRKKAHFANNKFFHLKLFNKLLTKYPYCAIIYTTIRLSPVRRTKQQVKSSSDGYG